MAQLTNPSLLFSAEDCAVFEQYPNSAGWKDVPQADQEIFKSVWTKVKALSNTLSRVHVVSPLRGWEYVSKHDDPA
jgi:hypothetical protein